MHQLSPQKEQDNVICKIDKKKFPFDYMKNGSLHKKSDFFVPFLMSSF